EVPNTAVRISGLIAFTCALNARSSCSDGVPVLHTTACGAKAAMASCASRMPTPSAGQSMTCVSCPASSRRAAASAKESGGHTVVHTPDSWVHRPSRMKRRWSGLGGLSRKTLMSRLMSVSSSREVAPLQQILHQRIQVPHPDLAQPNVRYPVPSPVFMRRNFRHGVAFLQRFNNHLLLNGCAVFL